MEDWKPETKVAAGAIAALAAWVLQVVFSTPVPPGVEGAFAVVVAYLIPSARKAPLE